MCLAIPGKVIAVNGSIALVDYSAEKREVIAKGVAVKKGDYVLVQFGMVVEKLSKQDALSAIENWKKLNSLHG
ncbi:HypC/HybG/HupF family hydrogenase formation chaperone [Candidatus Woesearchaeota archaeon]|nr:HypC/HybG/HupF family hydrogenase formation chaperone [Candidatus Woesearchaeota archaeon]